MLMNKNLCKFHLYVCNVSNYYIVRITFLSLLFSHIFIKNLSKFLYFTEKKPSLSWWFFCISPHFLPKIYVNSRNSTKYLSINFKFKLIKQSQISYSTPLWFLPSFFFLQIKLGSSRRNQSYFPTVFCLRDKIN